MSYDPFEQVCFVRTESATAHCSIGIHLSCRLTVTDDWLCFTVWNLPIGRHTSLSGCESQIAASLLSLASLHHDRPVSPSPRNSRIHGSIIENWQVHQLIPCINAASKLPQFFCIAVRWENPCSQKCAIRNRPVLSERSFLEPDAYGMLFSGLTFENSSCSGFPKELICGRTQEFELNLWPISFRNLPSLCTYNHVLGYPACCCCCTYFISNQEEYISDWSLHSVSRNWDKNLAGKKETGTRKVKSL